MNTTIKKSTIILFMLCLMLINIPNAYAAAWTAPKSSISAPNVGLDSSQVNRFWKLRKEQLGDKPYSLPNLEDKEIILLLGQTGIGKSAFVNRMIGHQLGWKYEKIKEEDTKGPENAISYSDESDSEADDEDAQNGVKRLAIIKKKPKEPIALMSNDANSGTKVPQIYMLDPAANIVLVDCPGFKDTREEAQQALDLLIIRLLAEKAKSVKAIICMIPYSALTGGTRGAHFLNLAKQLDYLVQLPKCLPNIFWGFTRYPRDIKKRNIIDEIKNIKKAKEAFKANVTENLWNTSQQKQDMILLEMIIRNRKNVLLLSPFLTEKQVKKEKKRFAEQIKTCIAKENFQCYHSQLDITSMTKAFFGSKINSIKTDDQNLIALYQQYQEKKPLAQAPAKQYMPSYFIGKVYPLLYQVAGYLNHFAKGILAYLQTFC